MHYETRLPVAFYFIKILFNSIIRWYLALIGYPACIGDPASVVFSQEAVGEGVAAKWKKKENLVDVHSSYHNLMVKELMQDFAASVLQVSDSPYDDNDEVISNMPTVSYEMPNGYNQPFGVERFRIPECLFNPALIKACLRLLLIY